MILKLFLLPFYIMWWMIALPIKFFAWLFKASIKVFGFFCFGFFILLLVLFI